MYTQQFVATVGGLDVETNITFTVCSLHHNVTTADQAVEYDACTTNEDRVYEPHQPYLVPNFALILNHPACTLDCDYNFYPGIVTSANQSVPLAIFRGTDNFYPQFLLTGAFTVEVPPKCQPTISFKGGQIITDALVIITECTGMRLVVAPGYNSLQMSPGDWTPMALTWSCSPAVNMTFELVDLLDSVLTVTIETENVTVERPHETSSTSRRFQQLAWFMTGCTETT
ncbi:unnamed protein product, partial [Mesorhabditis spiculigera]